MINFCYFRHCFQYESMKLRTILCIVVLTSIILSCDSSVNSTNAKKVKNKNSEIIISNNLVLDSILARKKLRAATDYGSLSYLIYRGEPMGYQFELLKDFTKNLGVELELVIESDMTQGIKKLNNNEIDLLAMGLTVTSDRSKELEFTSPIMTTRQMLVQRKPDGYRTMKTADEIESKLLRNHLDLADKTIYVQKGTIFEDRLKTISDEIADTINIIIDNRDVEDLILAVSNGEIDYTISDEHIAIVNSRYYHNIDAKTTISFQQKIAWAAQKDQTGLVDTINNWLDDFNNTLNSRLLYNKYFKNIRAKKIVNSQYNSYTGGQLSPYDDEIKEAADIIGWDWRMLASLVYQESEFKPNVRSWVGAYGLMQLMPSVMEELGLDTNANPGQHLVAGVKHLISIDKQIPVEIVDSTERVKFLLASYNCGLGHILDARRLAEKYNKDPNIWTNNVDSCILKLSEKEYYHDPVVYNGYVRGSETFFFVQEITERTSIYNELIGK